MFETKGGGGRALLGLATLAGLALAAVVFVPASRDRVAMAVMGTNPFSDPLPTVHTATQYPESPLVIGLSLEAKPHPGIAEFADRYAERIARRAIGRSGTLESARSSRSGLEAIGRDLALALQEASVYELPSAHFFETGPEATPRYMRATELTLMYAHIAYRLDIPFDIVRAPDHLYLSWGEGSARMDVQPTCLWFEIPIDPTGHKTRPCPGRIHTMDPGYLATPTAGLRLPDPLPVDTWTAIPPSELAAVLMSRRSAVESFEPQLTRGLAAVATEDWEAVRSISDTLDAIRKTHPTVWPAPDEQVLHAALAWHAGKNGAAALEPVFDHYEHDGEVEVSKSDAHAVAMWLDVTHRRVGPTDWNARLIPLFNRYSDDPERLRVLCSLGEGALASTEESLGELMPMCL